MLHLRRLRQRAIRIAQVDWADRALLVEAIAQLARARFALRLVPFPAIAKRLGGFAAPQQKTARPQPVEADAHAVVTARRVGWAVTRAARHIPFEAVCLPQALAAHAMLKRRGIASTIHFGATAGTAPSLSAHAWLDAVGVEVTGYPIASDFTEVACIS